MLTRDGGKPNVKPCDYSPPKGPTNQMRDRPGLGGGNYGTAGTQGKSSLPCETSGSPGLHGTNSGKVGTQR